MDVSKFLSKVIGIYLIVVSVSMFTNMQLFMENVNALIHQPQSMFVAGFMTLIIGIMMVVSHNIWRWNWQGLITLIGWITLLKAVSIVLYPQFIDQATTLFMQNINVAYATAGIDFVIGFILSYIGFRS